MFKIFLVFYFIKKDFVCLFILDAFVDLLVMICIILNTLFLALDHHNMDQNLSEILATGNYVYNEIILYD